MGPEPHPSMSGRGNRAWLSSFDEAPSLGGPCRWPLITIITVGICMMLPRWPASESILQFDRTSLLSGQIWRLLTCHLTHWSASHEFWSVGAFAVLGLLGELCDRRAFVSCCIGAALACSISLLLFWPDIQIFRGMSGVGSALFTWLVVLKLRTSGGQKRFSTFRALLVMLLIGFIAKVTWEALTHHSLFVSGDGTAFVSLPGVHAIGGAVGICMAMLIHRRFFPIAHRYN